MCFLVRACLHFKLVCIWLPAVVSALVRELTISRLSICLLLLLLPFTIASDVMTPPPLLPLVPCPLLSTGVPRTRAPGQGAGRAGAQATPERETGAIEGVAGVGASRCLYAKCCPVSNPRLCPYESLPRGVSAAMLLTELRIFARTSVYAISGTARPSAEAHVECPPSWGGAPVCAHAALPPRLACGEMRLGRTARDCLITMLAHVRADGAGGARPFLRCAGWANERLAETVAAGRSPALAVRVRVLAVSYTSPGVRRVRSMRVGSSSLLMMMLTVGRTCRRSNSTSSAGVRWG